MVKEKQGNEFEYRLTIAPHFNERQQIRTTLITLETTKRFASFRYELSVREEIRGKEIRYSILGLKAPQLSLPASGTAQFIREYDNLKGKHDVIVQGLDGMENVFTLQFFAKRMASLKSPKKPFVELVIK